MQDASNGDIYGFSDVQLWHRPLDMPNRRERKYQSLAVEEKESYKWILAAKASKERLAQAKMITFIEDREGDFYEQLSSISQENVHYIIRSKNNRKTTDTLKAWEILSGQPILGSYMLSLQTDYRKKRIKQIIPLKVRYATITLAKGEHIKNNKSYPNTITLQIVEAFEEKKDGISWKLLTTHPIKTFEDAYKIIEWYSQRWMIEQIHRLLKSKGFQIEDSELENGWAIRKICIDMLSSLLKIIQMNIAYNEPEEGQKIEVAFTPNEIECLKEINHKIQENTHKQKNHNNPQKLKWATWIIGRLGGWKGYDSQGPPRIIVLKTGLDKFNAIYYGWQLARDVGTR